MAQIGIQEISPVSVAFATHHFHGDIAGCGRGRSDDAANFPILLQISQAAARLLDRESFRF